MNKIFLFLLIISISLTPLINASWDLTINSVILGADFTASGQFIAGTSDSSNDGLDALDGRMLESPSYSIPIYSILSEEYFMVDYKSDLTEGQPKKWSITEKGSREFRTLGEFTQVMTWDLSKMPSNIKISLIDYGSDSNRVNIVKEINLRDYANYDFNVSSPYGEYRYFDLIMTSLAASNSENVNSESSGGGSSSPKKIDNTDSDIPSINEAGTNLVQKTVIQIDNSASNSFTGITRSAVGLIKENILTYAIIFLAIIILIFAIAKFYRRKGLVL